MVSKAIEVNILRISRQLSIGFCLDLKESSYIHELISLKFNVFFVVLYKTNLKWLDIVKF